MTDRSSTDRSTIDSTEIRREDDDELLGFVGCDQASDTFQALTVFGGLLGEHSDADSAERQIRAIGLASLAEPWWVLADGQWQRCHLIEASPDRVLAVIATYAWAAAPQVIASGTPLRLTEPADTVN